MTGCTASHSETHEQREAPTMAMHPPNMLFTSESVTEGHPDKLCDQVSDAVLDACLTADPGSRVACNTYVTMGMMLVGSSSAAPRRTPA